MREAVIVSTARTPIGKAYRGAFNDTSAQELAGHAIEKAVERAGIEPSEVGDLAAFLVSEKNSYMTGTTVEVCGGITKYIS